jgi:hypothetical protein
MTNKPIQFVGKILCFDYSLEYFNYKDQQSVVWTVSSSFDKVKEYMDKINQNYPNCRSIIEPRQ